MSERVTVETQVDRTAQQTRAPETDFAHLPVTIIEPSQGWISLKLKELIEYRDLLFFLAWRDVSVRYKQTVLEGYSGPMARRRAGSRQPICAL